MTIKANQIHMDVLLISKLGNIHTETMFVPNVWLFSIILLLCEFYPHRQTFKYVLLKGAFMVPKIFRNIFALKIHTFIRNLGRALILN